MNEHQCTCAVCRGFEPWVGTGPCFIKRHIAAAIAVEQGIATWWDANTDN